MVEPAESESETSRALRLLRAAQASNQVNHPPSTDTSCFQMHNFSYDRRTIDFTRVQLEGDRETSDVMHMPAAVVLLQNPILSECLRDMNARLDRLEQIFKRDTKKEEE